MIPIDIQVSRSKVKVKGQAYSSHVGEGGHLCFTNSYILLWFCLTNLWKSDIPLKIVKAVIHNNVSFALKKL